MRREGSRPTLNQLIEATSPVHASAFLIPAVVLSFLGRNTFECPTRSVGAPGGSLLRDPTSLIVIVARLPARLRTHAPYHRGSPQAELNLHEFALQRWPQSSRAVMLPRLTARGGEGRPKAPTVRRARR